MNEIRLYESDFLYKKWRDKILNILSRPKTQMKKC